MWRTIRICTVFGLLLFCIMPPSWTLAVTGTSLAGEGYPIKGEPKSIDWSAIEELDLKLAGQIALAGNPTLAAGEARVRQAMERVNQAKGDYWPRLDLTASGARMWLSENDLQSNRTMARLYDPAASVDDPEDQYYTGLMATWKLFDGFARKFTNAVARYGRDQSQAALDDSRRYILSAVAGAYFTAQLIRENMEIARADERFNQRQLVEAQARHQMGTGSLSDTLNFEIRINDARNARIRAERNYEAAKYALAALLGLETASFPATVKLAPLEDETQDELSQPNVEELIAYAHAHRPDIHRSEFGIRQAEAQVKIARSRFYPNLNLWAAYEGTHIDNLELEEDEYGASVGLSLSFNLFAGGANRARVQEARSRTVELERSMQSLKVNVSAEVRDSVTRLLSAQEQLHLQRENHRLVQRNRDLVEREYTAGQASLVRLNEAQRDLITAQGRLALALATLRQAWFALETDTGHILEGLAFTCR